MWLAAVAAPYGEEKGAASSAGSSGTETRPPPPARWCAVVAAGKNSISLTSFFAGGSAKGASPCAVMRCIAAFVTLTDRVKLASQEDKERALFLRGRVRVHEWTMSGRVDTTKYVPGEQWPWLWQGRRWSSLEASAPAPALLRCSLPMLSSSLDASRIADVIIATRETVLVRYVHTFVKSTIMHMWE